MNELTSAMDIKQDLISLFRQNTGVLESASGSISESCTGNRPFMILTGWEYLQLKMKIISIPRLKNTLQGNYDVDLEANPFKIDIQEHFQM